MSRLIKRKEKRKSPEERINIFCLLRDDSLRDFLSFLLFINARDRFLLNGRAIVSFFYCARPKESVFTPCIAGTHLLTSIKKRKKDMTHVTIQPLVSLRASNMSFFFSFNRSGDGFLMKEFLDGDLLDGRFKTEWKVIRPAFRRSPKNSLSLGIIHFWFTFFFQYNFLFLIKYKFN